MKAGLSHDGLVLHKRGGLCHGRFTWLGDLEATYIMYLYMYAHCDFSGGVWWRARRRFMTRDSVFQSGVRSTALKNRTFLFATGLSVTRTTNI